MADKKISALTAATTPLAGTEVLPIVQSGSTVKVAVSNLTAGRSTSVGNLTVTTAATAATGSANITSTDPTLRMSVSGGTADKNTYEWRPIAAGAGFDYLQLRKINDAQTVFTELLKIDNDGNLTPSVAAKGINFTANTPAAGMTSQLLNWYEEGTWTATLTGCTTSPTASVQYVRVGKAITLSLNGDNTVVATSNATTMTFTGMPTVLRPSVAQWGFFRVYDNGAEFAGLVQIGTNGVLTFYKGTSSGTFTSSGDKGVLATSVAYSL